MTNAVFPKTGGNFYLSGQVNLGPSFGLTALDLTSQSTNPASTGVLRLANVDTIVWRNAANTGNVTLSVNGSNNLVFEGSVIAAGGTVMSVALSVPSIFTVSGSPVSSSGTLSFSLNSQAVNLVFASPTSGSGAPTFRSLAASDIPTVNAAVTATTANALTTPRTINNTTFDGSANVILNGMPSNTQTGTTYTFALSDSGKLCTFNNSSAVTVTIPPASSVAFPVDAQILVSQYGTGQVTFAPGAGVTINSLLAYKSLYGQFAGGLLIKTPTANTWLLIGTLAP
jgi:hypothetical protein